MQNDFPNFGKKYKIISTIIERNCGKYLKWCGYLVYDPEANKVLIRGTDEKTYWIDFPIYLATMSWPYATSGRWPTANKYMTLVTDEELKYINENTTEFVEFGERKNAE